tara:strand:+ start:471 stop:1034 length:564 start_codon:yes stop_codon:yes gene_type:complete
VRIFLSVLILILSLQSWTKADDIRDFEIEGMSIGNNLLDHVSLERIKSRLTHYYPKSKKYVGYMRIKEASFYDQVAVRVIDGDKNYKIASINGILVYKNNISDCYKKKKEIAKEIYSEIGGERKDYTYNYPNDESKSEVTDLIFSDGRVRIFCTDYSIVREEKNYQDHLSVGVSSSKYMDWLVNEAR